MSGGLDGSGVGGLGQGNWSCEKNDESVLYKEFYFLKVLIEICNRDNFKNIS